MPLEIFLIQQLQKKKNVHSDSCLEKRSKRLQLFTCHSAMDDDDDDVSLYQIL